MNGQDPDWGFSRQKTASQLAWLNRGKGRVRRLDQSFDRGETSARLIAVHGAQEPQRRRLEEESHLEAVGAAVHVCCWAGVVFVSGGVFLLALSQVENWIVGECFRRIGNQRVGYDEVDRLPK